MHLLPCMRSVCILIGGILFLSACGKRKSTQGAVKPLESFSALYADQLMFDETSRDTLRSLPASDGSENQIVDAQAETVASRSTRRPLSRSQANEVQARLVDIPVPLQSKFLERYCYSQDGRSTFGYDVRGYVSDYMLFYEQGLERSGWHKVAVSVTPFEAVLMYDKPKRFCVVSLRHELKDGSIPMRIIIHTGIKEASA